MVDIRVDPIDNSDHVSFLVRGTDDLGKALGAVRRFLVSESGYTNDEAAEWEPALALEGWFRWNPCSPVSCYDGGGHPMHLGRAKAAGRGNWRAIEITGAA